MDFYAPNVTTGTPLTEELIGSIYRWIESLSAATISTFLSPYQYGLTLAPDQGAALDLKKSGDFLILRRCTALTNKGGLIFVVDGHTAVLTYELDEKELMRNRVYNVLVQVDINKRNTFGPESQDLPLRKLFSLPYYKLVVQGEEQELHAYSNSLQVGRLQWQDEEWQLDENYIVPCMHLGACPALYEKYLQYLTDIRHLLEQQPKILQHTLGMENRALMELRELILFTGSWLAIQQIELEQLSEKGAPHRLVQSLRAFANQTAFHLANLSERPQFYNLLHENIRGMNGIWFTPDRLLKVLHELLDCEYDHRNIRNVLLKVDDLMELIVPIFKALAVATLHPQAGRRITPPANSKKDFNDSGAVTW